MEDEERRRQERKNEIKEFEGQEEAEKEKKNLREGKTKKKEGE